MPPRAFDHTKAGRRQLKGWRLTGSCKSSANASGGASAVILGARRRPRRA